MTARRTLLGCALLLGATGALAGCGAGAGSAGFTSGGASVQPPGGSAVFSPYVDVTLTSPFDLAGVAGDAGARSLTLAFVTAAGACEPSWGGQMAIGAPTVAGPASRLQAAGVALRVSFGGAAGSELAKTCASVPRLEAAYASVLDRYRAVGADFDLEGAALADRVGMARRARALARLQAATAAAAPSKAGHSPAISLTLPATSSGLPAAALEAVRTMSAAGVHLSVVNLLAMDYGANVARGRMGAVAVATILKAHRQLAGLGRGLARWSALGVTVMVGVNDSAGEVFTLEDARQVVRFASRRGLGLVSIWSLARDGPCAGSPTAAQSTCSGVNEPPYAFSRVFGASSKTILLPRRAVDTS